MCFLWKTKFCISDLFSGVFNLRWIRYCTYCLRAQCQLHASIMRVNIHVLDSLRADLELLRERLSTLRRVRAYNSIKYLRIPRDTVHVDVVESVEQSSNKCSAWSLSDATSESQKCIIERIETGKSNGEKPDITKGKLNFSRLILKFSQCVLIIYYLNNCITYEPVRTTGSKCGVHVKAISNELQSGVLFNIWAIHLETLCCA